jgi:RNA polymerase sigma-70 factor, ECF subfamily
MAEDARIDDELVRKASQGDREAFSELVLLHADRVQGALRRFGLTPSEAGEVSQEVFLRAWRGLPRFEQRARFSTWLYRIAFNEAQRRLSRRPPGPAADQGPDSRNLIESIADSPTTSPENQALDREFEKILERALEQLPAEWRAAVVLRDVEGLSTRDAAEIAGVAEPAFKSRLHRGRMELRALLEPYLMLEED